MTFKLFTTENLLLQWAIGTGSLRQWIELENWIVNKSKNMACSRCESNQPIHWKEPVQKNDLFTNWTDQWTCWLSSQNGSLSANHDLNFSLFLTQNYCMALEEFSFCVPWTEKQHWFGVTRVGVNNSKWQNLHFGVNYSFNIEYRTMSNLPSFFPFPFEILLMTCTGWIWILFKPVSKMILGDISKIVAGQKLSRKFQMKM